jgi:hypothetical protein
MEPLITLPPGVRLDVWPTPIAPAPIADPPEVVRLREELRKTMPELVSVLDLFDQLRPMQEVAGRLSGPPPGVLMIERR